MVVGCWLCCWCLLVEVAQQVVVDALHLITMPTMMKMVMMVMVM